MEKYQLDFYHGNKHFLLIEVEGNSGLILINTSNIENIVLLLTRTLLCVNYRNTE